MEKEILENIRCELSALIDRINTALRVKHILLTTEEAARSLNLSEVYLNQLRKGIDGPAYIKIGGAVRYRPEDLEDWVNKQIRRGK